MERGVTRQSAYSRNMSEERHTDNSMNSFENSDMASLAGGPRTQSAMPACLRSAAVFATITLFLTLAGCAQPGEEREWTDAEFDEIVDAARDTTVRIHMWGGSSTINEWVDGPFSDHLAEEFDITLERIAMDAPVFVNRLLTERQAGRGEGSIDVMWIDGENFKNAREGEALYGPFLDALPNFNDYVQKSLAETDFGYPIDGYEAPWGTGQFVFEYDSASVDPPESFAALPDWVRRNPGQFTYPQPPDFTGSAFVRQAFVALTGGHQQYMDGFDEELYEENAPVVFDYLQDIEPYLWESGETYPSDLSSLDTLFQDGEVAMSMSYDQARAQSYIEQGRYPESIRTFVMEEGSFADAHNLAIAFNSPNIPGALTVINAALSPEMQLSKMRLENWGDSTSLNLDELEGDVRADFEAVDLGEATLPSERLDEAAIPEIPSEYLSRLDSDWERVILRGEDF